MHVSMVIQLIESFQKLNIHFTWSMSLARPLSPFEYFFVTGTHCVQLAAVLESKEACDYLVEKLKKNVLGLRVKTDYRHLIALKNPEIKVHKLPDFFPSLEHACIWTWQNTTPDIRECMGSIAANDRTVVLNLNHTCGDGGYLKMIIDRAFGDLPDLDVDLPDAGESLFEKQIANAKSGYKFVLEDDQLTHIFPHRTMEHPPHTPAHYITFSSDAKRLSCYDPKTKKCNGLTETLWISEMLAACAFNGKVGPFGTSTCVDLRPHMGKPATWVNCNTFSNITVQCPPITPDQTLGDMQKLTRKDFSEKLKAGVIFDYLKGIREYQIDRMGKIAPPPGIGIEVTNVGPVMLKRPVTDIWMQQTMKSTWTEGTMSLLSYSIMDETGRNDVVTRLRFSPTSVRRERAEQISKAILHIAQHVPLSAPIWAIMSDIAPFFRE